MEEITDLMIPGQNCTSSSGNIINFIAIEILQVLRGISGDGKNVYVLFYVFLQGGYQEYVGLSLCNLYN